MLNFRAEITDIFIVWQKLLLFPQSAMDPCPCFTKKFVPEKLPFKFYAKELDVRSEHET